ncbi:histidine phosphatase family protein [Dorea acetigenes]|uniref:Histidine phosphatase family protein n=1 Tax=Dorea acetigenes TaxID=2981787 RepID=A0ABT2RJX8_9FIRM|nr:histidine phosphatase family protein [Dorea acetigenes]MCU6685636.1 histidine phosphatase family protein [Dorea acetigenes]SCI58058.1 Alpha-ribazole phosphatase [uncultured Clostridium sp.]
MKLYFVRHGETDWNKARKIQGQVDIPLNEFGRMLAKKTAKGLADIPFTVCYTSPMGRAKETAELILAGRDVPIVIDERIVEMGFGEYEGKCCSKKGWELPDNFHCFFTDPVNYIAPKGGEGFADVKKRTGDFLEELYQKEEYKDSNILITTHGAALAGLLNNIKKRSLAEYWGVGVHKNCAVTEVLVEEGVPRIIFENKVYYDDVTEPWEDL